MFFSGRTVDKKVIYSFPSTGVIWQDRQHRELFKRVELFVDAVEKDRGKEELLRLLEFLDEYVVFHFHDEEKAMEKAGFPDSLSHMQEHTGFIDELSELRMELSKGYSQEIVDRIKTRIIRWLKEHIGRADRELGSFLLQKDKGSIIR